MKQIIFLFVQGLITIVHAGAQCGDFSLKNLKHRSYIKISANPQLKGNGFKRLLIGENYRKEWTDSILVPVLDFKNDFGGLTPKKEGGGKQTHTLHIEDSAGYDWVLRSVKKFPEKVIPEELKGTIAEKLVYDGISASYPYSVLSVGTLAKASAIPYLPNTVVYIPDDPALGEFRSEYKNSLALLELRSVGKNDIKTYDTQDIVPELQKNNERTVAQNEVLKARLLDNFIMDFDRHEGQWEWVKKDSAGKKYYTVVPKDRDQAFFKAEGFLVRQLSHKPELGQLQGLRAKPKNILTLNWAARNFDRVFLNELDETAWSNAIDAFLSSMKDEVITDALSKQPQEIQKYHAKEISDVLKNKKASFKEDMMRYYRFISRTVSVAGSNDAEIFTVTKNSNGTVKLSVQDVKTSTVTYERLLDASVTKEIRLYGLEGDDRFVINGESNPMTIRLIGGPGEDVFINTSNGGKVFVYDVSFEKNTMRGKFKNKISSDPLTNEYQRINDIYNSSSTGPVAEYSGDGGLFLGLRHTIIKKGFRKEPYAGRNRFYVTKALSSSAWHVHYDADFISVGRNTDLLFRSDARLPTVRTHFFGYGNNSVFNKDNGAGYYKVQYSLIEASLMLRHSPASWLQLQYGPLLQHFHIQPSKNQDHYISALHSSSDSPVYDGKWYTGGVLEAIVNTKNNELIPTRGIHLDAYARQLIGINENTSNFTQAGGRFSFYTDALFKKHIILASSFGVDCNFGNFEIPQAQYLGLKQNLRGYRYQRFAGRSRAYNNTELRINFGTANFYLIKGPFGVLGFHDAGRVWMNNESSDKWHTGYGGGIWLAPFNKLVVTALLTHSKEEKVFPMVTFGFQF